MDRMSDEELLSMIDAAWKRYDGDVTVLESAIGALVLGREVGWHAVRLCHSRMTFNKYEKILGIKFRDVLPERGPAALKLQGIRMLDKVGKFWQALSGGLISAKDAAIKSK